LIFRGAFEGLQIMGLLETRLLNFENVIMLSVNEGKLPLGNSQNTYIPFDIRRFFDLHTFLENDSIYAYHFYRLIQDSKNVHLLFNALSSGVNTGEKAVSSPRSKWKVLTISNI
jgi:inactivated superfamily I helicase